MTPEAPDSTYSAIAATREPPSMEIAAEAGVVIGHMLGDRRSIIDPAVEIWTADAAEDLRRRIEDHELIGTDLNQWQKLDQQLAGAAREVVLMAAELVFLREHPLRKSTSTTRREHVERVLQTMAEPVQIPDVMAAWLSQSHRDGGFDGGQAYNGFLWKHLIWIARFVKHWNGLPEERRSAARADPWDLQSEMLASGDDQADIRNTLQFLSRPDVFEPVSSTRMKLLIRNGLSDRIGGPTGEDPQSVDRDLLAIRHALTSEVDGAFGFWYPEVRPLWDDTAPSASGAGPEEPRARHYWMYAPGRDAEMWEEFSSGEIMAIGWDQVGDLSTYANRDAIRAALDPAGTQGSRRNDTLALWQFQHEIEIGDVVFAKRGMSELIGRGIVTSDARFDETRQSYRHVRSVDWTHIGSWVPQHKTAMKTLTDITSYVGYVEDLELLVTGDAEAEPVITESALPIYDKERFLDEVYLADEQYDRLQSLLTRKKNVILAGPPGVGKTFAAKRLAYSMMGIEDPERVQMVQFHQSYSYEDFLMGYRPTESGGFALTEGPFYRFCQAARDDGDRSYFFIIDEINRGNISKIFGELLMLIEADKRGSGLKLLYKNETFTVPKNVHIIGMMNTADRSLAVLDYALRRRFGFFAMEPGFDTAGFAAWQRTVDMPALDRLVTVLTSLNAEIAADPALGAGFRVGHSFLALASPADADEEWLESVVEDEVIPLLDEYWFDDQGRHAEWSARLRAAIR